MFADQWSTRDGRVVPEPKDLKLSNDAIALDRATILYADLDGSTSLVDRKKWWFAAEVYKSFLHCAAKLVKAEGGVITSYDGDRVMALFIGEMQTTNAARCGLKINYAVRSIINPALKVRYPNEDTIVRQVVGIDTGPIRAARTGVRGDNGMLALSGSFWLILAPNTMRRSRKSCASMTRAFCQSPQKTAVFWAV